jgi:hypothetical protein
MTRPRRAGSLDTNPLAAAERAVTACTGPFRPSCSPARLELHRGAGARDTHSSPHGWLHMKIIELRDLERNRSSGG